jgi:hypothetical protein
MEKKDVRVAFLVGDLRKPFTTARDQLVEATLAEPLPKNSKCLSDTCPSQERAKSAILSVSALDCFKDDQYIGLKAAPRELIPDDDSLKPLHAHYAAYAYVTYTSDEIQKDPLGCDSLGKGNIILGKLVPA